MVSESYSSDEIRDRLSISTNVFRGVKPVCERSLAELPDNGIRRIELAESPDQFDMADMGSMRFVGNICRDLDIRICAYHACRTDFDGIDSEEQRRERTDRCKRQIDTLLALGGTVWSCHAGRTEDSIVRRSYEELARHIEGTEAIVALENFSRHGEMVGDRIALLDLIDHPQVAMVLDIGHVRDTRGVNPMTRQGGPTEIIGSCGHRLRHVHLHGFTHCGHFPPLCDGDRIQWCELFATLRAGGYAGYFNFEPAASRMPGHGVAKTGAFPDAFPRIRRAPTACS